MKNLIKFTALLCLLFCFISCEKEDPIPDEPTEKEFIIKPGVGINDIKIGDLGSKVEKELGAGFEKIVNVGGSGNANYNYYNYMKGIDVIFGQHNSGDLDINTLAIKSFSLGENFEGKTDKGIKIGSSKAEVVSTYGEAYKEEWGYFIYKIGMIITYNKSDQIQSITVMEI